MIRVRPSSVLLLVVIVLLACALIAQQHKEARLRTALAHYKSQDQYLMLHRLDKPFYLNWSDGAALQEAIKVVQATLNRYNLRPIVSVDVDDHELEDAGQSLTSRVKAIRPEEQELPLQEKLDLVLEPLHLGFVVHEGSIVITSRRAVERSHQVLSNILDQPIRLTWTDGTPLKSVIEQIRLNTRRRDLPNGVPIYFDPDSLKSAGLTWSSSVKAPPPSANLPLREQLRLVLESMGLAYQVKEGCLFIASQEEVEEHRRNQEDRRAKSFSPVQPSVRDLQVDGPPNSS
jgi:hypothetical protein